MKSLLNKVFLTILFQYVSTQFPERPNFNPDQEKEYSKSGKDDTAPRIQIRAILVRCPTKDANDPFKGSRSINKNISSVRSDDILQFHGYDKDELLIHSEVKECKRKLVITVKLNNCGRTMTEEEFIVVDHVYDPIVRKRSRLLNPLVFKLKQEQVLQLYGLTFIHMVNSEAKEEVLNKNLANFTGCDTTTSKPTCGMSYIKDKVIPFSEGFCCSCDSYVNMKRQPSNREKEVSNIGFSAGQLGVPIAGPGLRSARSSGEEVNGPKSKEFLAKGLWGDLFDSGFQEVQSFRVPRSIKGSTNAEAQTTSTNNEKIEANVEENNDIQNNLESLSENEQNVESTEVNKADYDSNLHGITDDIENDISSSLDDSEAYNSEFGEIGLIRKEMHKPWLLQTDNKFHTFIQRLKVKDKKPSNMTELMDEPIGIQLKHYLNPPLEIARGFVKSDFKSTDRKEQSPWEVAIPDKPIQPIGGRRYNDCHKYMHILSKLLEQGIDLEEDLNLAPEDIIERCKEPEKGNRFIKSIIRKAERKLKNKNIDRACDAEHMQSPFYRKTYLDRFNHYRFRRDSKARPILRRTLTSITCNRFLRAPKNQKDLGVNNSSQPEYIVDIIWDTYQNFTGSNDSLVDYNKAQKNESHSQFKQTEQKNISGIAKNHSKSDDNNNSNIEIIWVDSLDYAVSNPSMDSARNPMSNNSFERNQEISNRDENNVIEELPNDRKKRNADGGKVTIVLNNGGPIISIEPTNNNSNDKQINITTNDNNLNNWRDKFSNFIDSHKTDGSTEKVAPYENDWRADINDDSDINSPTQISLNTETTFESEYNSDNSSRSALFTGHSYEESYNQASTFEYPCASSMCQERLIPYNSNSTFGREEIKSQFHSNGSEIEEGINLENSSENKLTIQNGEISDFPAGSLLQYQINPEEKNLSELSVSISNGILNNNFSDNMKYSNSELKENINLIDDQATKGGDADFDIVIDKSSIINNIPQTLKNQHFGENNNVNFTRYEIPGIAVLNGSIDNKIHFNKNTNNINIQNPQPSDMSTNRDYKSINKDIIYVNNHLNNSNFKNKEIDQAIKTVSNFSGKKMKKTDSHLDILEKRLSLTPTAVGGIKKLKFNYFDNVIPNKELSYKINNSVFGSQNNSPNVDLFLSENRSFERQNQYNASDEGHNQINTFFGLQSNIKPLFALENELTGSYKIKNKNWQAENQFHHVILPNINSNQLSRKNWDQPNYQNTNNHTRFRFDALNNNVNNINKGRRISTNLMKSNSDHEDKENILIQDGKTKGNKYFPAYYLKSMEQNNNLNNGNDDKNNISYFNSDYEDRSAKVKKPLENISNIIQVKNVPNNESQFSSLILPANITEQKGIRGKLLFIPDENNVVAENNSSLNDSEYFKIINKRDLVSIQNLSEGLSDDQAVNLNNVSEPNIMPAVSTVSNSSSSQNNSINNQSNSRKLNAITTNSEIVSESPDSQLPETAPERKKRTVSKCKAKSRKKVKRQILSSGVQYRGGQSCIDRSVPQFANPVTYHESAHCLRFSDLWYSVYRLKRPFIEHSVHIQLYEKHNYPDGRTHWHEVTKGMQVNVGTFVRHIHDALPTLAFTYIPFTDQNAGVFCLDPAKTTLLMPQPLSPEKSAEYPQAEGGPKQYMLVRDNEISFDGEECDKAGVSFEAFARQPDRCAQPRGTCLKNQPIDMWRHDMEAKSNNRPGKYFLENYASIPSNPFKMNQSTHEEFLALDYMGRFTSAIEVEVRSDLNAIVRTGSSGQLTEVYVDATCEFHTRITVIVTNLGLASSGYFPRLASCPVEVPEVWTHNEGPIVNISPQHRHIFRMSLYGTLPVDRFHCSLELLNEKRELVATRRIRVQRHDRCLCQWHCLCACIGSIHGLACIPMSVEHYHAAGFQGSLPVVTSSLGPEGSWLWHLYNLVLIYFATMMNILLLGLIKAIFGLCCCSAIGSWGLWLICPSRARSLKAYKEPYISNYNVVKDDAGYAINPINGTRNVRILSKTGELCINFIFFAAAPVAIVIKLLKICCPCLESDRSDKSVKGKEDEDSLSEESKKEMSIKAKKMKIMGKELSESESEWSFPLDLEMEEDDDDTDYVLQERDASQKNLQEHRTRSRGGADIDDGLIYYYEFMKEASIDNAKPQREHLTELEKEMAEHLVETLQDAYTVYRNLKKTVGGADIQPGFLYSIKGHFSKSGNCYQFIPTDPVLQYWGADNNPVVPPLTLDINDIGVMYPTAEDVMLANELSLLPRGLVINVWHSLDDESNKVEQ